MRDTRLVHSNNSIQTTPTNLISFVYETINSILLLHLFTRLLNKKRVITANTQENVSEENRVTTQKSLISHLMKTFYKKRLYLPDLITYQTGCFNNGKKTRNTVATRKQTDPPDGRWVIAVWGIFFTFCFINVFGELFSTHF